MKENERNEWLEIYDNLKKIKALKPWETVSNLIPVIIDYGRGNLTYVTIMGNGGDEYGMIFYSSAYEYCKAICQYERPMSSGFEPVMFNHESISVIFDDKDDISETTMEHLKNVGISFRGKKSWITIEQYGGRLVPHIPKSKERKRLLKDVRAFLGACEIMSKNYDLQLIMIDKGIAFLYNCSKNELDIYERDMEKQYDIMGVVFDDDEMIAELKKIKQKKYRAQVNLHYSLDQAGDEDEENYFPEFFSSANAGNGSELFTSYNVDNIDEIDFLFDCLMNMFKENGRPSEIIVNDIYILKTIEDFCRKLNIKIVLSDKPLEKEEKCYFDTDSSFNGLVDALSMLNLSKEELQEIKDDPNLLIQKLMMADKQESEKEISRPPITMSSRHKETGKTFVISVSLHKGCYRHIAISADASFGELHEAILAAFDFDDDHMHEFYLDNKAWSDSGSLTKGYSDSSYNHILSDYLTIGQKFLFLFDFGDDWRFSCKLLKVQDQKCTETALIKAVGDAPEQYPEW